MKESARRVSRRQRPFPRALRGYAGWLSRSLAESRVPASLVRAASEIGSALSLPEHAPFVSAHRAACAEETSQAAWEKLASLLESALARAVALHRQPLAFNVASAGKRLAALARGSDQPAYEPELAEQIDAKSLCQEFAADLREHGWRVRASAADSRSASLTIVAAGSRLRSAIAAVAAIASARSLARVEAESSEELAWTLGDERDWRSGNKRARIAVLSVDPSASGVSVRVTVERSASALGESMKITVDQLRKIVAEAQRDMTEPFPKTIEQYASWLQQALRIAGAPEDFCYTVGQMGRVDDSTHDEFISVWHGANRESKHGPGGPGHADPWDDLWSLGLYDAVLDAADAWKQRRGSTKFNAASVADRLETLVGRPLPKLSKAGKPLGKLAKSMPAYELSVDEILDGDRLARELATALKSSGARRPTVASSTADDCRVKFGVDPKSWPQVQKRFASIAPTLGGLQWKRSSDPDADPDDLVWRSEPLEDSTLDARMYFGLVTDKIGEASVYVDRPTPRRRW